MYHNIPDWSGRKAYPGFREAILGNLRPRWGDNGESYLFFYLKVLQEPVIHGNFM